MSKAEELQQLKQQLAEIRDKIEKIEKLEAKENWEMKCPFEFDDVYYSLGEDGTIDCVDWTGNGYDLGLWGLGNTFSTKEKAELERKRRNLLTRFRAFRDECNGDWKPNWYSWDEKKYFITHEKNEGTTICHTHKINSFEQFGFFKNLEDAQCAIELFGDEIIELFVEAEQ